MSKNRQQNAPAKVAEVNTDHLTVTGLSVIATEEETTNTEDANFQVIEESKKRNIFEVIKFVQNKGVILQKLELLSQTEKNLDSFNLGKDGVKDNLQIMDGEGNKFQTYNTSIIEKVIDVLKIEIGDKRATAENELALEL